VEVARSRVKAARKTACVIEDFRLAETVLRLALVSTAYCFGVPKDGEEHLLEVSRAVKGFSA